MGGALVTYRGGGDLCKGFVGKDLNITEDLQDVDVVGEIIFKRILRT
jgi:hypothetical protein